MFDIVSSSIAFNQAIEVEHLSKIYGSTLGIQDVTFNVESEIVGFFCGPNGTGKPRQ